MKKKQNNKKNKSSEFQSGGPGDVTGAAGGFGVGGGGGGCHGIAAGGCGQNYSGAGGGSNIQSSGHPVGMGGVFFDAQAQANADAALDELGLGGMIDLI